MPTSNKRETALIRLFVSAYENGLWAADSLEIPDEQFDGGVDGLVKRTSDGCRLAIEHTLIQPHVDDRRDFALFEKYLLTLENDPNLAVPGRITWIYVRSGTLNSGSDFSLIAKALHEWLSRNVKCLPLGESYHECAADSANGRIIRLLAKVYADPTYPGTLAIRRFFELDTLEQVVNKALDQKLPKLISTMAEKRIFLLEREQMMLSEQTICEKIEAQASTYPELAEVEIWFAETPFYARDGVVYFKRYENNKLVGSLMFLRNRLIMKSLHGLATVVERI